MNLFVTIIVVLPLILQGVAAVTLRVMPLGDALTAGSNKVPGSYRTTLLRRLENLGYTTELVGNELSGGSNHEGHKNFNIANMIEYVDEFLDAHDPDVILLMIGSKDVEDGGDFQKAADGFDDLITKIATARPLSRIFAANLPQRKNQNQNDQIQKFFNPKIPGIIEAQQKRGTRVDFVDVNSVITFNDLETNVQPSKQGYAKIGRQFASGISNAVSPKLGGISRGILRAEGGLDRRQIIITFTKPFPRKKCSSGNFFVNGNISVLDANFQPNRGRRVVILTTSEQTMGETYKVTVGQGSPAGKNYFFTPGWRMLVIADWHLGEKYVFAQNQDQIDHDVDIMKHLKATHQGELLMIPGDTNAGFWDRDNFYEEMKTDVGQNLSREAAVLEAGNRCYSGLLSSFRSAGYPNVVAAIGDHELGTWKRSNRKGIFLIF